MKEVKLVQEEQLTLNDVSIKDQLGFILDDGRKGHFVYVGDSNVDVSYISAICLTEDEKVPNVSLGTYKNNRHHSVPKKLDGINQIKKLYKFDTRKQLYKWLSE
jgi:hypothetical protein